MFVSITAPTSATQPVPCTPSVVTDAPITWQRSDAVGRPTRGSLRFGVQLPVEGSTFVTWDPGTASIRSADWRRWGTDHVVRNSLCAIDAYRAVWSGSSRVLIGDISLPAGGKFGPEYGGLGHASHQNGLDIDVYYPRTDGAETIAANVNDIDRVASQLLINQFVARGAVKVFVGRGLGFSSPHGYEGVVQPARKHFDHFHVRFAEPTSD
jgi:murein endopeptidase